MNVLYCTYYDLNSSNAAFNRIRNISHASKSHYINIKIVGSGSKKDVYEITDDNGFGKILFNRSKFKTFRHSNAMKYIAEASKFYLRHLHELILNLKISLIIIYSPQGEIVGPIINISKKLGVKVIADCGEYYGFSLHSLLNGMLFQQAYFRYFQMKKLDGITFVAHHTWDQRADKLNLPKVHIPSITIDKQIFRTSPSNNKIIHIVFMGRLWSREMPNIIFKALKKCVDEDLKFKFHLIGTRNNNYREKYWMNKLKKIKALSNFIKVYGYVDNYFRDRILAEADMFILLREEKKETDYIFPFRLPEFLMSGNLTITSKVSPISDYLKENYGVKFISKSNNPNELANLIISLSRQPQKRYEIGANGREFALNNYSFEVIGKRLSSFLKNII